MVPKFRAVLFDFDGTLTPSLPLWVQAFQVALAGFGVHMSDVEIVERFFYRDSKQALEGMSVRPEDFRSGVHAGLREAFREAILFPGVAELIAQCRAHGLQTAIVTSAPRFVIDDVSPRLGLANLFHTILTADDVKNFKPHPEPVLMALNALGCEPQHALMIGDSTADVLSGKAAGAATALYMPTEHERFYKFDTLRESQPSHIFVDHAELRDIIGLPNDSKQIDSPAAVRGFVDDASKNQFKTQT
jgi:HAD superfamily hydrolase (TIGR01509 family)